MSIKRCIVKLVGFTLRQMIGDVGEVASHYLQSRLISQTEALRNAIRRALDRSWQAMGIALGDERFVQRAAQWLQQADTQDLARMIDKVLQTEYVGDEAFRQDCFKEWQEVQKQRLDDQLELDTLYDEVNRWPLAQRNIFDAAHEAVRNLAAELEDGYPNLGRLIARSRENQPPLLVAVFAFFFRQELRKCEELADELNLTALRELSRHHSDTWKKLDQICEQLDGHFDQLFGQLDKITDMADDTNRKIVVLQKLVQDALKKKHIPLHGPIREEHSDCMRTQDERRLIGRFLDQYRQLDAETQRRCPELLNQLGRLQVCVGQYGKAEASFSTVAGYCRAETGKAEALYNAHLAALEAREWDKALRYVMDAANMDHARYHLFPWEKFDPQRILGASGLGVVFLCTDKHTGQHVIVRTLHQQHLDRDIKDIFHEACILWRLQNPHIIGARSADYALEQDQRPYMVLDYFQGQRLGRSLKSAPANEQYPVREVEILARQIALAMQAAHKANIMHRNLKPGNVLIGQQHAEPRIKVIDFGLVLKQQLATSPEQSTHQSVLGRTISETSDYAAPEQKKSLPAHETKPHTDIYAFGRILAFLLYGTLNSKLRHRKHVPSYLNELVEKCTDDNYTFRPPNFDIVLSLLDTPTRIRVKKEKRDQRNDHTTALSQAPTSSAQEKELVFRCPACNNTLYPTPDEHAGDKIKCPCCQTAIIIPSLSGGHAATALLAEQPRAQQGVRKWKYITPGRNIHTCPFCGFEGELVKKTRGSCLLFLFLCLLYVIPGIIYAVHCRGYKSVCARCGHTIKQQRRPGSTRILIGFFLCFITGLIIIADMTLQDFDNISYIFIFGIPTYFLLRSGLKARFKNKE